jgi:hypothetical protein
MELLEKIFSSVFAKKNNDNFRWGTVGVALTFFEKFWH